MEQVYRQNYFVYSMQTSIIGHDIVSEVCEWSINEVIKNVQQLLLL